MSIRKVGVVGAGQMGNGIAHVLVQAGYDVLLNDITQEALDKGVGNIRKNMERQVGRGKMEQADMDAALSRITTTLTLKDLGQTDLVIESATERETVKQAIFEDQVSTPSLRRRFNPVLNPKDEGQQRIDLLNRVRANSRRLEALVSEVEELTEERVEQVTQCMEELRTDIDLLEG